MLNKEEGRDAEIGQFVLEMLGGGGGEGDVLERVRLLDEGVYEEMRKEDRKRKKGKMLQEKIGVDDCKEKDVKQQILKIISQISQAESLPSISILSALLPTLNPNNQISTFQQLFTTLSSALPHNPANIRKFIQQALQVIINEYRALLESFVRAGIQWNVFRVQVWRYCVEHKEQRERIKEIKEIVSRRLSQRESEEEFENRPMICDLRDIIEIDQQQQKMIAEKIVIQMTQASQNEKTAQIIKLVINQYQLTEQERLLLSEYVLNKAKIIQEQVLYNQYSSLHSKYSSFLTITNLLSISHPLPSPILTKLQANRNQWIQVLSPYLQQFRQIFRKQINEGQEVSQFETRVCLFFKPVVILPMQSVALSGEYSGNQMRRRKFGRVPITKQEIQSLCGFISAEHSCWVDQIIEHLLINLPSSFQHTPLLTTLYSKIIHTYTNSHSSWFTLSSPLYQNYYQHPQLTLSTNSQAYRTSSLPPHLWNFLQLTLKLYSMPTKSEQIENELERVIGKFHVLYESQFVSVYMAIFASKHIRSRFGDKMEYLEEFVIERGLCINYGRQLISCLLNPSSTNTQHLLSPQFYMKLNHPLIKSYSRDNTLLTFEQINTHNPNLHPISYSNFYRNHWSDFIYGRFLILMRNSLIDNFEEEWCSELVGVMERGVEEVVKCMIERQRSIVHNSEQFYESFRVYKYIYIFAELLIKLWNQRNPHKIQLLIEDLLLIMKNGNIHPLMRQYISIILAKMFFTQSANHKYRELFLSQLNSNTIDLNTSVSVLLILGYQMLINFKDQTEHSSNIAFTIFQKLLEFISCHHAYVRSIAQYYVSKYVEMSKEFGKEEDFGFLEYLCFKVWKHDKDCIKIMKNIGIVVEGFREMFEHEGVQDYLGFERVEEYPGELIKQQLQADFSMIIKHLIGQTPSFKKLLNHNNHQNKINSTKGIQLRYRKPDIIIVATLLQKVHNFGHILRTVHNIPSNSDTENFGLNVLLVVPSKQPLEHPQCLQLIPSNSQVHVIEIRQDDLKNFITLFKKEYPLLALEQCANSVQIQKFRFPRSYMLLLGNERIGAPASLLNQADHLLQIPQIGKVRSLNVHVSMVICLWHGITCHE